MSHILESLGKYMQAHFKREEKLQQVSNYTFNDEHKQEHIAMIVRYNELVQKAGRANADNISDIAVEIGKFLQEWLTDHVIESDLPMRPYVERMREQASKMADL